MSYMKLLKPTIKYIQTLKVINDFLIDKKHDKQLSDIMFAGFGPTELLFKINLKPRISKFMDLLLEKKQSLIVTDLFQPWYGLQALIKTTPIE